MVVNKEGVSCPMHLCKRICVNHNCIIPNLPGNQWTVSMVVTVTGKLRGDTHKTYLISHKDAVSHDHFMPHLIQVEGRSIRGQTSKRTFLYVFCTK